MTRTCAPAGRPGPVRASLRGGRQAGHARAEARPRQPYGNLMKVVDGYPVEILDTLEANGQLDDTVVIRTSDHGEMGLAHRMQQEELQLTSTRIPLVYPTQQQLRRARSSRQLSATSTTAADARDPGGGRPTTSAATTGRASTTPGWCWGPRPRPSRTTSCSPTTTTGRPASPAGISSGRRTTSSRSASGAGRYGESTTTRRRGPVQWGDVRHRWGPARAAQPRSPARADDGHPAAHLRAAQAATIKQAEGSDLLPLDHGSGAEPSCLGGTAGRAGSGGRAAEALGEGRTGRPGGCAVPACGRRRRDGSRSTSAVTAR